MDRLRVLYLLADYGHDLSKETGYKVHVAQILHHVRQRGHRAHLLTVSEHRHLPEFNDCSVVRHGYVRGVHKLLPYTGLLDSFKVLAKIHALHKEMGFHVIHERYGLYSLGGMLAARMTGLPYLLEVNAPLVDEKQLFGAPLRGMQRRWAQRVSRWCIRGADAVITVSSLLRQRMIETHKLPPEKVRVFPNAADRRFFELNGRCENRRSTGRKDRLVIGYAGTLQPWFGIENLLHAFRLVAGQLPKAYLQIVGDGNYRAELESLARTLRIKSRTTFLGSVPHAEVLRYVRGFDIAVAPYRPLITGFYGSSLKVFEYMAAGKAIVASQIGQIGEILENRRTALLVEPGEIEELAQAILRLAAQPRLRTQLARRAREVARQRYTWDRYSQKLLEVYRDIMAEDHDTR